MSVYTIRVQQRYTVYYEVEADTRSEAHEIWDSYEESNIEDICRDLDNTDNCEMDSIICHEAIGASMKQDEDSWGYRAPHINVC